MTIPNLLTVPEAAKALRVSVGTAWKEVNSGAIASLRVRDRVFVSDAAISEYLTRNTRPHVAA
jgi:excisionase family DNA binding protein